MNKPRRILLSLFTLLPFLAVVQAQRVPACGSSVTIDAGQCQTETCSDIFPITTLNDCTLDSCFAFSRVTVRCCGITVRYLLGGTDFCLIAQLKAPEVQTQLRILAEKEDILIPTCSGGFVPASLLNEEKQIPRTVADPAHNTVFCRGPGVEGARAR